MDELKELLKTQENSTLYDFGFDIENGYQNSFVCKFANALDDFLFKLVLDDDITKEEMQDE